MAYAVELSFDEAADAKVRAVWQAIEDVRISTTLRNDAGQPHMTLGVAALIDMRTIEQALRQFASAIPALTLSFEHIGLFHTSENAVFLAPIVTAQLLHMHTDFHGLFAQHTQERWPYYLPGGWVPHCTLAHKVPSAQLATVIGIARSMRLPLRARVRRLAVVEVAVATPRQMFSVEVG